MSLLSRWCLAALLLAATATAILAEEHSTAMELRHNLPFVQVMVNGKGPFTFGIDTGTGGQALVTPQLAEQLKLAATGEIDIGDPSGRNQRKASTFKLQTLEVAGVQFKDVEAVEFQPSPREGQVDGILGFPLFRDYLLTMDYPQERLTLASGALKPDGGNMVVPFTMPRNVPVVQLQVGSQRIDAHVDSRGMGLSFPGTYASDMKFGSDLIVIGRGRTVSNEFEIKGGQLAGDVRLGGYTFPQPFVAITPVLPSANFGSQPLHNFSVTFDQKNLLMQLLAKDKSIVLPPPQRRPAPAATAAPAKP
jgi:hypothetical protein